jgi:hypothetical protein
LISTRDFLFPPHFLFLLLLLLVAQVSCVLARSRHFEVVCFALHGGWVANIMLQHIITCDFFFFFFSMLSLSRLGAIQTFIKANHVADDRLYREFFI